MAAPILGMGARIKAARGVDEHEVHFTQSDIARALDMSRVMTVSEWERDVSSPSAEQLIRLALLLRVSTDWLLTGKGPGPGLEDDEHAPNLAPSTPAKECA